VSTKHNDIFIFIFAICYGYLTIIRPALQNLETGACSANSNHIRWGPIRLTNVLKYIKNSIE